MHGCYVLLNFPFSSVMSFSYQQWQKRTKLDVPRVGDQESSTVSSTATALIGRGGGRPFRHTKQTQAKPLDKLAVDYERKLSKLKKREADGGSSVASALAAGRGTSNVRSELKTAERIQKERKTKEKRRQKNARPSRKVGGGKPSSKGKGGGRR